eukprot:TRINITY_DN6132_c0_g2_i8.p1 TRINITY_DN6132_c0_g2~~TRINITY_DN6132_c0_g2_i8.p1  ORF type:complete len:260 (-),score=14.21 TRINITY_DN6132_c0_g2_i8:61-729(-)
MLHTFKNQPKYKNQKSQKYKATVSIISQFLFKFYSYKIYKTSNTQIPNQEVDKIRLTPIANKTTIRPAQASKPFVPRAYLSPDSDQISGVQMGEYPSTFEPYLPQNLQTPYPLPSRPEESTQPFLSMNLLMPFKLLCTVLSDTFSIPCFLRSIFQPPFLARTWNLVGERIVLTDTGLTLIPVKLVWVSMFVACIRKAKLGVSSTDMLQQVQAKVRQPYRKWC